MRWLQRVKQAMTGEAVSPTPAETPTSEAPTSWVGRLGQFRGARKLGRDLDPDEAEWAARRAAAAKDLEAAIKRGGGAWFPGDPL